MATTNSTYTSPAWRYYAYPSSISPIPDSQRRGIIVLCSIAIVSCTATLSLLGYLSYLFITGRNDHGTPMHKNQYMLLIFSLVLADFQLDLGFLLGVMWLDKRGILAPSAGCTAQGWLINVGDLASGFFVFAIASHTFLTVVYGCKIGLRTVYWSIVFLWVLALGLITSTLMLHPNDMFVASGSWCSLNGKYNTMRLWSHYVWDFIAEFGVVVLYMTTFTVLRKRMGDILPDLTHRNAATVESGYISSLRPLRVRSMSRATWYMILYPLIYLLSTLPVGAGRISAYAGNHPSTMYLTVAGDLMACGGWMNCLVYSLTRRIFQTGKSDRGHNPRRTPSGDGKDNLSGRAIEKSPLRTQRTNEYPELPSPARSTDKIVAVGKAPDRASKSDINEGVTMERTWEVRTEELTSTAISEVHELGYRTSVSY